MKGKKMVHIEKQTIAYYRPANPMNVITILYDGKNWVEKIERIWKDKKVERYSINIIDDGEKKVFECGLKLYEQIKGVCELENEKNDRKEIKITIRKDSVGPYSKYDVVTVAEPSKVRLKRKLRSWFKKK